LRDSRNGVFSQERKVFTEKMKKLGVGKKRFFVSMFLFIGRGTRFKINQKENPKCFPFNF
jgi:hypothetical protein